MQRNPPDCVFCTNNAPSKGIILKCIIILCERLKTTQYNLWKDACFSFSASVFSYYLTTLSMYCSILIFLMKTHFHLLFLSTLRGWAFPWALLQKLITWLKCVPLTILAKTPRKIDKYFPFAKSNLRKNSFTHLKHFVTVCFLKKLTCHLGKVNKNAQTERVSNWIDAQSSCWGSRVSTCSLFNSLKRLINYCCRICTILCIIFK